jgi:hypothetical protein
VKLPLDELSSAHLVAIEIPPVALKGFEHDLLHLVAKIRAIGPHVAIIVQPSLRRQTQQALWIHRWNKLDNRPFRLIQTCSCQLGNRCQGCHFPILVGLSYPVELASCFSVPTPGAQPLTLQRSLSGNLLALAVLLLSGDHATPPPVVLMPEEAEVLRRLGPSMIVDGTGPQRTPDSHTHCSPQCVLPTKLDSTNSTKTLAFPTDSKEKQRNRKNERKARGEVIVVKKRKFVVEDHHDDCGDDLTSLDLTCYTHPCHYDTDSDLSDQDHNQCLLAEISQIAFPIDMATVAKAQQGSSPAPGRDPRAKLPKDSPCLGCKHYRARNDWEHNRTIGERSYHYDEPVVPVCDGCQKRKPRYSPGHSYIDGECRWAIAGVRASTKRSNPHEPAIKAENEPTAHAPATFDGEELGAEGEEEIAAIDRATAAQAANTGSSSSSAAVPGEGQLAEAGNNDVARRARGPDQNPRERRAFRDIGDNPERPDDWTNFDIGRVVRLFRTNRLSAIRLSLRKLHVRWWHASHHTMQRFLERVGVADNVIKLIPEIVQTCRVCRQWAKPGPANVCSTEFADTFNAQVECDLLFVNKKIVFHLIDRCTRWHAAREIPGKEDDMLMTVIDELWISIHGAPKELIVDGESGIAKSHKTTQYLARKGIKLHVRAKDQHARFIERRGALLRDTIHRIESQLKEEGLAGIPFSCTLAEAVFCGNALLSINGSSPYNSVYGRVPALLPGINQIDNPGEANAPSPGLIRHTHRLREISIQAMVEGSARARLGRAMNTRTTPSSQNLNLSVGDEVDFFRVQNSKDVSGWFGPADVVDVSRASRGIISIKHHSHIMEVQTQQIRRHLHFLTFFSTDVLHSEVHHNLWQFIRQALENLSPKTLIHLGNVVNNGTWTESRSNAKHPGLMNAIRFFAENHLSLEGVVSARIGMGLQHLPHISGYAGAITIFWRPGRQGLRFNEKWTDSKGQLAKYKISDDYEDWQQLRVIQILLGDSCTTTVQIGGRQLPEAVTETPQATARADHLSPITEVSHETESPGDEGGDGLDSFLHHADKSMNEHLVNTRGNWDELLEDLPIDPMEQRDELSERLPLSMLALPMEDVFITRASTSINKEIVTQNTLDDNEYVEFAVYPPMTNTIPDLPKLEPDDIVVFKVGKKDVRREVVKRDDDTLTTEQVQSHWGEVQAAMLKELQTWSDHKCFSRRPREGARNVIDTRWVIKFKMEQSTTDVVNHIRGGSHSAEPAVKKTIRARLTVRGFKDCERGDIERYAGTSSRCSQKALVSEAVLRGWDLITTDISKAFLQGVTYDELAKLTGERPREVNFYLPASNIPVLRKVKGFENFNPATEVLHCDKPGTGLVDAPRAFSIKLSSVTCDKCGLMPSKVDQELCFKHVNGRLVCLMTKHVDDLKIAGEPAVVQEILTTLQKTFGELKISKHSFLNCGVQHTQCPRTKEISLDQVAYATNLRSIAHAQLSTGKPEDLASPDLHQLFMSLLGAIAYLAHTRVDILVFVSALQRHNAKPEVQHVKKLNKLLAWIQKHPKKLMYKQLGAATAGTHLRIVSDAAFKRETETGYSLRGALFLRAAGRSSADIVKPASTIHILDFACKSQRHVTRSTFSAELLSAGDALDQGLLVGQLLHEIHSGVTSACEARDMRGYGGFSCPLTLYVDAKSVFAAVAATFTKLPAEKSLLCHVQFVRELLERRVLGDIVWIDTRDMSADGLTKGAVSRELLHQIMDGSMNIHHKTEQWRPKTIGTPQESFVRTFLTYESQSTEVCVFPQPFAYSTTSSATLDSLSTLQLATMPAPKKTAQKRPAGSRWEQGDSSSDPEDQGPNPWAELAGSTVPEHVQKRALEHLQATDVSASSASSRPPPPEVRLDLPPTLPKSSEIGPSPPPPQSLPMIFLGESPLAEAAEEAGQYYKWKGKTYKEGSAANGVNSSHSIDDIQEYMSECPIENTPPHFSGEIPYQSIEDWLATLRQASMAPGAAFFWPSEKLTFQRALAVALNHLPPDCFITIKSSKPVPRRFLSGSDPAYLDGSVQEVYHGSSVFSAVGIAEQGFKAGLGAGSDSLKAHFGVPVAGVYVAKSWTTASYYPMERSSKPHSSDRTGVPGGSVIAMDGSYPMRMVVRCLAKTTDQLWHKGSNQSLYRPRDLHITHFCIYAVGPQFVHSHLLSKYHVQVSPQMNVFEQPQISVFTSRMIASSVVDSPEESATYPLNGQMVVFMDEDTRPLYHAWYLQKGLIERWQEGNRPAIRIGTVHTLPDDLAKYLTEPEAARTLQATGSMAVECSYRRGLDSRMKIRDFHQSRAQGTKGISELFWETTQSTDELPLARAKPGLSQELQSAGGGQLSETSGKKGSQKGTTQNPSASGEALAKKQAKRRRQKSEKTDDQIADDFARKQCREHTAYLRIASATYLRCPEEYYDSYAGVWTPPAMGEVFDHTHRFHLVIGSDPIPKLVQAATPKKKKNTRQYVVNQARQDETNSLTNLVSSAVAAGGGQLAETGGPGIVGRQLVEDKIPSSFADTAHYTLTTQREYTSRGAASGTQAPAPPIGVGTEEGAALVVSRGYKILLKECADPADESSLLNRIEEQPPLVSIAYAWTKTAANKINQARRQSKQDLGSSSSSGAALAPIAFVSGGVLEAAPVEDPAAALSEDSEPEEHVPFAWTKLSAAGTSSTSANPPELATVFDGKVWTLLEGELDALNTETGSQKKDFKPAELRESIQKASAAASTQEVDLQAGASSSSAVAASSSPPAVQETVDTTPWESDARFQFNLKYLAWMLKKSGGPPPVFVEPQTDNPMEVDYSIDE